eukprot:scaffold18730_cov54-Phaeocystis_antarctica.AAC.5
MATPLGHARAPHTRTPHTHPPPHIRTARDLVRCTLWCVAVLVVRGGREARPEQAASREARPEPAGSFSLTKVSPHPHGCKPPLRSARFSFLYSHRMICAAAFCALKCVDATTSPSSPAPEFSAATIGLGSGEDSPPSTCGCSDELEALTAELEGAAVLHAAELEGVRAGIRGEVEVKLEVIRQFVGMTPPSSPPSPPSSPSPPPVRDCAASPCVDGYWQTESGIGCA